MTVGRTGNGVNALRRAMKRLQGTVARTRALDPIPADDPQRSGTGMLPGPLRQNRPLMRRRFRPMETIAERAIKSVAFVSFAVIVLIFAFVFREASPLFFQQGKGTQTAEDLQQETYGEEPARPDAPGPLAQRDRGSAEISGSEGDVTARNLLGSEWQPVSANPKYGLLPLVVGTLKVTAISVSVAAPIGILAALFTACFARPGLKQFLKPTIEFLSGFPSVVIGFFALVAVATLFQDIFGYRYRLNAFVGGIALSLAVIPIVYTVADDALTAVPRSLAEASSALGATKWQTALFVILPAATPGVFAAILLGVGRAFGETMIVLMATGNAALVSLDIFEPVRTMSATVGAEMAEVVFRDTHYGVLYLIGSILFVFSLALNAVAEFYVRRRLAKRFGGGS